MRSANTLLSLLSVLGAAQHALGQFSTRLGGVNTAGYDFSVVCTQHPSVYVNG